MTIPKKTVTKPNPYELGRQHGLAWVDAGKPRNRSANPYREFSGKWALYNRGFNSTWMNS